MAIALGTSPAMASGFNTITTATFSPGADTLLVAELVGTASPGVTVANSGTARTWTRQVNKTGDEGLAIWTAPNPTSLSNITVTASGGGIFAGLKVYVVTGAHPSSPAGQTGSGTSTTNNATVNGYTSSAAASRGFAAAVDANGLGTPASTDDETIVDLPDIGADGMAVVKAANSGTSGTTVTFNLDAAGTGTPAWSWVALEILPASTDASAGLTVVEVVTTAPTPAVSAGSSAVPATVTAVTTAPVPAVSAGANATPTTVTAVTSVPVPAVTTDTAEIVTPDTVTATTATPTPAVSAGAGATPGTVLAAATVWLPDVDAQFNADITLPDVPILVTVDGAAASVPVLPGDQLDGLPGQIEFNGFPLGRGTVYRWIDPGLVGWRGKDTPDSGNAPRANRSGSSAGRPLGREKTLTWNALLRAPRDEVEAAVLALENATPLLDTADQWPLVVNDLGTPYLAYGRIDRVHIPLDRLIRLGHAKIVLQWILADPRRYNINATGTTVPVDTTVTISNAGNASTHPILRFPGPVLTPRLHNLTSNRVLEISGSAGLGEELVVNTDLGTCKVGPPGAPDTDVPISNASVSIEDWTLARGDQSVRYTADLDGTQCEVLYRDAWN